MSLNYFSGFSLFLLLLIALNIYFFCILNDNGSHSAYSNVHNYKASRDPDVFREIQEYLHYLPNQYKIKNSKFVAIQNYFINLFNSTVKSDGFKRVWHNTELWSDSESLFPNRDGAPGQILEAMRHSQIALADNAPKGTQLKLLLLLEGKQKLFFKPKRYDLEHVINGNIYAGFDRHNSEVYGYYLAMVMNYTWVAPAVVRRVNIKQEIIPVTTLGLKQAMIKNNKALCIYGKCFYCKTNETVCEDERGLLEGAAILYLDRPFRVYKHPWRRSYNSKIMEWETNMSYCKKIVSTTTMSRLLNLIDIAIFDFLIQNGDRHRYEVYKDKIVLLDNGKGLGNPILDELDILAPLYQCCMLRQSTWRHLELLSGGSLTETLRIITSFQGEPLISNDHMKAFERRLLKVYATIQLCIGKYGSAKVFKNVEY